MTEEVEENLGDGRGYENGTRPLATSSATSNGPVGRFRNFRSRLNTLTNSVTIEPVMFLHMLGISLTGVIVQDLYIERICRVKLGYPADTCAGLVVNAGNTILEERVDSIASKYSLYRGCIEAIMPIGFAMFLGSWSDKHGSKIPLLLPMFGYVLSSLSYTLFTFLPDVPPHYILISSIPVSLSGGMVAVVLSAFSFISALTTNENRSFRIAILEAFWFLGAPVGLLSGARIYKAAGFAPVFIIAAVLYAGALLYGIIFIRESKPEIPSTSSCVSDMFNVDAVKDTIRTVFDRREPPRRRWILLLILTVCFRVMTIFGPNNCMFLFTRHQFQWNEQAYSTFVTTEGLLGVVGGIIMTVVGIKMLKLCDTLVGLISSIGFLAANFLVAFAPGNPSAGWVMYLAAVIQMFGGMTSIMVRSMLSKIVPRQELGKVFTFVACGETATPIMASALYSYIYVSTQKEFPGAFSLFTAGLNSVILLNFVYFYFGAKRNPEILQVKEDEEGIIN